MPPSTSSKTTIHKIFPKKGAILLCFGSRRKVHRHRRMLEQNSISPERRCLLGFVACVWILCWLGLGPELFFLPKNNEETLLVLSGWTPCCGRTSVRTMLDPTVTAKQAERLFLDCESDRTSNSMTCGTLWAGNSTPETVISNTGCTIESGACPRRNTCGSSGAQHHGRIP